jgi:iron complex transport system substrate-binding protein
VHLPRVGAMRAINSELVAGLAPDVVVGIPFQEPALRDLARAGVRVRALPSDTLADDFATIATLGRLTGRVAGADRLLDTIHRRLSRASRATAQLAQPRALCIVGVTPIYVAGRGSYIDDLFAIAHVRNIAGNVKVAFPALSAETVEAADPDVLVVPRGTQIPAEAPWSRLRAVRDHRIVTIDEDDLLRPGPRVADVVDALVRGVARYRAARGRTAKANTDPSGSRRTVIGMP